MSDAIKWFPLERLPDLEHRLAEIVAAGTCTARRDALACCFGLHGLRVSEVCNLQNKHLFVPTQTLTVETLKNGRDRKLTLDKSLIDEIRRWQADAPFWQADAHGPILPARNGKKCRRDQFEQFARRLVRELIGAPLTFHALRHTFAMRLYASSRDLFLVQQSLGHASVKSTEVYARSLAQIPRDCLVRLERTINNEP